MNKPPKEKSRLFFPVLLAIAYVFYAVLKYNHGIGLFDEGNVLAAAQRVMRGDILYKNITVVYSPGEYWLLAGLFRIFGESVIVERLMWLAAKLIGLIFIYLVSKKIMPPFYAFLAGVLYVFTGGALHKVFYTSLTLPVLFFLFLFIETKGRRWLLLAGLFAGLNILFRQDTGLFAVMFGFLAVLIRNVKGGGFSLKTVAADASLFFMPVISLTAPALMYFYNHGALGDLYHWCFEYTLFAEVMLGKPFPSLFKFRTLGSIWQSAQFYLSQQFLYYVPLFILSITLILLLKRYTNKKWEVKDFFVFLIFSWGCSLLTKGFLVPLYEHFLQAAVPIYVLGCYLLSLIHLHNKKVIEDNPSGIKKIIAVAFIYFLPVIPVLFAFNDLVTFIKQRNNNTGNLVVQRRLNIDVAPVYMEEKQAELLEGVVGFIRANTRKDEAIFCTTVPGFYFLTGRENPTDYEFLLPNFLRSQEDEKKMVEIVKNKARYIIHYNFKIGRRKSWDFKDYAPLTDKFLKEECKPVANFGPYIIYEYDKKADKSQT